MDFTSQDREALNCELAVEVLRSTGELRFIVRGASMLPSIFPGDILLVRNESIDAVHCGDVVLCSRDGRFYAHRVERTMREDGQTLIVTRGDALAQDDPPIGKHEFLGQVLAVVRHGRLLELTAAQGTVTRLLLPLVRQSDLLVAWLLRYHALRTRLSGHGSPAASVPKRRLAGDR
ncbi:MAG TPA: S24/S26 family peptidase [Candidatus Acidoferrum sp.]|nr:S24/S26 family peptidase [Candidatus Acidoferrum sp.]